MSTKAMFWKWFTEHQKEYVNLDDISEYDRERLLNILLEELHKYDKELFFQIGFDNNTERHELIITAEGQKHCFDKVATLVNDAPNIKNWDIIAFKPAQGLDFEINYEGLRLYPQKMWYMPLVNEETPNLLGLRIYIPNYDPLYEQKYLAALYQILDTFLGEKALAESIGYIELDCLPNQPEKYDLIELYELPNYLNWLKSKAN